MTKRKEEHVASVGAAPSVVASKMGRGNQSTRQANNEPNHQ
jgi:hypothetical protein